MQHCHVSKEKKEKKNFQRRELLDNTDILSLAKKTPTPVKRVTRRTAKPEEVATIWPLTGETRKPEHVPQLQPIQKQIQPQNMGAHRCTCSYGTTRTRGSNCSSNPWWSFGSSKASSYSKGSSSRRNCGTWTATLTYSTSTTKTIGLEHPLPIFKVWSIQDALTKYCLVLYQAMIMTWIIRTTRGNH